MQTFILSLVVSSLARHASDYDLDITNLLAQQCFYWFDVFTRCNYVGPTAVFEFVYVSQQFLNLNTPKKLATLL